MRTIIISLVLLSIPCLCFAHTIHVPGDSATIQAGINGAEDGDTVLVAPGTYSGNITVDKSVFIIGEGGAENTIINSPSNGFNVPMESLDGTISIIGFSIRNAEAGIFAEGDVPKNSPLFERQYTKDYYAIKVSNCTFSHNYMGYYGHLWSALPPLCYIDSSLFEGNYYSVFGAVNISNSQIRNGNFGIYTDIHTDWGYGYTVTNCVIEGITDTVFLVSQYAVISNCTIRNNSGLLAYVDDPDFEGKTPQATFYNSEISHNTGNIIINGHLTLDNTILFDNLTEIQMKPIEPWWGLRIRDCLISNNHTTCVSVGGDMKKSDYFWLTDSKQPYLGTEILNTTFVNNNGDVIRIEDDYCEPNIIERTIISNNSGIGIYIDTTYSMPEVNVSCSDIFGNAGGNYEGIEDQTGLNGNIFADPLFCDTANGDYTIWDVSPCAPENNECETLIGAFGVGCKYIDFSLLYPRPDSVLITYLPTFVWESIPDTTAFGEFEYFLHIDSTEGFVTSDSLYTAGDTTIALIEPLSRSGQWWWKVRAFNDTISFWSNETFSFRADNLPQSPSIISPLLGEEVNSQNWLIWTESYDADEDDTVSYTVEIDNNPDFSNPEAIETGIMDFPEPPGKSSKKAIVGIQIQALQDFANLKDDSLYYWRVRAVDKFGGESEFTDGSAFFTLNLVNSPPLPPTDGFSPSGDIVVNNLLPEISWYPGSDPDLSDNSSVLSYKIKIDKDGELELDYLYQYLTSQGITSVFVTDSLDDERQWFYVVQTVDDEGAESEWSEMQSFWTNWRNDAPEAFTLSYPPDTGWSQVYNFPETFWWAASTDPDPFDSVYYRLYVSIDSEFTFVATYDSIYQTSFPVPALEYGTHYWWKVIAIDTKGNETECDNVPDFLTWVLGDANADNSVNLGDAIFLINLIFNDGLAPDPFKIGDVNGDCYVNLGDAVYLVNYVFNNGPEPLVGCDEPPEGKSEP